MGCYGLYEYKYGNYFAISNSFLRLVEFLYKTDKPITFNEDFANYYLSAGITPLIPDETLINEIKILPRNYIIHINKKNQTISYDELDFQENTISIDSELGIELLDEWYYRWIGLIRDLRTKTNFITLDISGGFDSRIVAALWLSANINLKNILIYSTDNNTKRYSEDLEIATEIANHFNFKLNQKRHTKIIPIDLTESLNRASYVDLGFHKHRVHPTIIYESPVYRFSGHCGGLVRNYPNQTLEEYAESILKRSKRFGNTTYESTKTLLETKIHEHCSKYNLDIKSKRLASLLYHDTRNRHHFGKEWVESYLYNKFTLAPLSDPNLSKLKVKTEKCNDDLLLFAVIFQRYCPDLLNFKIEGEREINEKTIEQAAQINEKYPFEPKKFEYIKGPDLDQNIKNEKKINTSKDIKKLFSDIFYSQNFIKEFEKYYSPKIYNKIRRNHQNRKNFPLEDVYASLDILKIHDYVKINNTLNCKSYGSWLDSYKIIEPINNELKIEGNNLKIDELLEKYHTLRIDVKNKGTDNNDLMIIEKSDKYSIESTPEWFGKSNGIGHLIKTTQPSFHMKLKMINDGEININLRGEDIKDRNGKRFPVYIDCQKFEINGENILEDNVLVCHDESYLFKKDVLNGEIISIHIEWLPFNKKSVYLTEELDMLRYTVDTEIFNFNNLVKRFKKNY